VYLNNMSLDAAEAAEVIEKLRGTSNAVKKLWLSFNTIGDGGARAIAELLRGNPPELEEVYLSHNNIGRDGIAALGDALRENTTVRRLYLHQNKGVDPHPWWGGREAEAAASIDALVAAIGVNTTLIEVDVRGLGNNPHQKTIDAALADKAGRRTAREHFLSTPVTKAAGKRE
jgi:Leucine Rich repeat